MDPSTYRTDAQLQSLMDETGDWVVNDASGLIIGAVVATLRDALKAAADNLAKGDTVRAISRLPPDSVIVFHGQMDRLRAVIADTPINGPCAKDFNSEK